MKRGGSRVYSCWRMSRFLDPRDTFVQIRQGKTMADAAEQQAIADLARQIVADVAPREIALFKPLSQAYFKDPQKTLKGGGGADRMLGFGGMSSAGTLLTPMI